MRRVLSGFVITAFDEVDARTRCLAAGATAFLLKPFDDQALLDSIRGAISGGSSTAGSS
jgi:FixJ family two-component response regulator